MSNSGKVLTGTRNERDTTGTRELDEASLSMGGDVEGDGVGGLAGELESSSRPEVLAEGI